jgi:hypothetical protein
MLRREIGCSAVTSWAASGVGVWHSAEDSPFHPFNPRASWFTYVAEEPVALTGTCVILQSCCLHGLTESWINIVLESIATMPDPWDVALKVGLGIGRDA